MCRLLAYASTEPLTLRDVIGDGLDRFRELSGIHGDGWGFAHADTRAGSVSILKKPERALESADFGDHAIEGASDAAIVHLRWATPGLNVCIENTHPFALGDRAFMHNGAIFSALEPLIPSRLRSELRGSTDSEKYFLAAVGAIERLGPLEGLAEVAMAIHRAADYTSLNAMMLTPRELLVVSWFNPDRIQPTDPSDYYDLLIQRTPGRVIVTSTGWCGPGWQRLHNRSISRIDRRTLEIDTRTIEV